YAGVGSVGRVGRGGRPVGPVGTTIRIEHRDRRPKIAARGESIVVRNGGGISCHRRVIREKENHAWVIADKSFIAAAQISTEATVYGRRSRQSEVPKGLEH